MEELKLRLIGALKITDAPDSIGIPIFGMKGGNSVHIPEMDGDLNITSFLQINLEDWRFIEYNLPPEFADKAYALADAAPVPYWIERQSYVIDGGSEASDLQRYHKGDFRAGTVLGDMYVLLDDARSGRIWQRLKEFSAQNIKASFNDLFFEPPVHSPYWITRFHTAVKEAHRIAPSPHPIDNDLRATALAWVNKFATKTDYKRIMDVIQPLVGNAITRSRATEIVFAFTVNKLETGNFRLIEKPITKNLAFENYFPFGIFQYYREHGWPETSFKYQTPYYILDPLLKELRIAQDSYVRAERMAQVFFGKSDAPNTVRDVVQPMLWTLTDEFYKLKREVQQFSVRDLLPEEAIPMLRIYRSLQSLDGVMNGSTRLSREVIDRKFGIDSSYIKELQLAFEYK